MLHTNKVSSHHWTGIEGITICCHSAVRVGWALPRETGHADSQSSLQNAEIQRLLARGCVSLTEFASEVGATDSADVLLPRESRQLAAYASNSVNWLQE